MIFNYILDYVCSKFNQLLSSWNRDILHPNKLAKLLWVCWWIVFWIFHPKINQNIIYNGHKRAHGIKFQSFALSNGLIGNLSAPYVGKWDDSTMSHESGLLLNLQRSLLAQQSAPLDLWSSSIPLIVSSLSPIFQTKSYA